MSPDTVLRTALTSRALRCDPTAECQKIEPIPELLISHQFLMCDWWHECCSLFCLEYLRFPLTHQENTVSNVDDDLSCRDHVKKRVEASSDHRCIQGDESEE